MKFEYKTVRRRKQKSKEYLPHTIFKQPLVVNQSDVKPSKTAVFDKANDKELIFDYEYLKRKYWGSILFLVISIFFFVLTDDDPRGRMYLCLPTLLISVILLIFSFVKKPQKIVLYREKGIIVYPGFWGLKLIQMRFEDIAADISISFKSMVLKLYHPNGFTFYNMADRDNLQETWALCVWYMDKNRPLPPGSAFDSFRQHDFEKRKKEGFPEPLYDAIIPTPEATSDYNNEREQYWKEEIELENGKPRISLLINKRDR